MSVEQLQSKLLSWVRHKKLPEVSHALHRGVDIEARDEHGNTALIVAAQNGHTALVKMLVDKGADVGAVNGKRNTPLHYAVAYDFKEIADMLLLAGADEYIQNTNGLTPYEGLEPGSVG